MRSNLRTAMLLTVIVSLPGMCRADPSADNCYLLSFFQNNGQDGLHLAYSFDGLDWKAINENRSLLQPAVGPHKLMRDPSIVRAPDGTFHMVWTTGWNDRIIGYANSKDLIHWSKQKAVPVMQNEPTARNCWAPELFYDASGKRYLIVWSTTIPGRFPKSAGSSESDYNHRMYYTATRDFEKFAPTKLFHDPGFNCIDGFVARSKDKYLLFFKDETLKPNPKKIILLGTAEKPQGPYTSSRDPITPQTWVEGPSAIRIGDAWFVYFDCYRKHRYGLTTSKDLKTWTDVSDRLKVPPGTRHGTVFQVDRRVLDDLLQIGK